MHNLEIPLDLAWAVELNRFCLELIGLWPNVDETTDNTFASNLRVGVAFITVNFFSLIPLAWSLVRVWGDMIFMIENLQVTLHVLVVSLQLVILRWKRKAFMSLVRMMAEDWTELRLDAEKIIMIRQARIARLIVVSVYVLTLLAFCIVIVLPCFGVPFRTLTNLTDGDRPLPLQAYYFYDTDSSPQFEITFVIQAVTMFLSSMTYTSVDAFLSLTIFHACGQLENFRRRLINLILCKDFDSALRNNVETHLRLIRFAKNIEDMFALTMLGLVLYFGIVFCFFGFLLLTVIADGGISDVSFSRKCFVVLGIIILLVHTFLYCGAGEIMAEQCEGVYRAMYDLDWYELEARKAKTLILLMIRAHEPFRITAGRIFPLTMTTFCSLLKTSAGYISFLLAMKV